MPLRRPRSTPRRLQDRPNCPQEAARRFQDAQDRLQGASSTAQEASTSLQAVQDRLQGLPNRLQKASKCLQDACRTVQNVPKLFQTPCNPLPGSCQVLAKVQNMPYMSVRNGQAQWSTYKAVAVYQGWSGGGSPAWGVFDPPDHLGESVACSGWGRDLPSSKSF